VVDTLRVISRKTGYQSFDRYKECGIHGLTDRSRRPSRYANELPSQVENYILNVKHEHPSWGARKIREMRRRGRGTPLTVQQRFSPASSRRETSTSGQPLVCY
jgi:hypothetical protein